MNKRSLMILIVAAIVAVTGAIWLAAKQQASTDTQSNVFLTPDLLNSVNEIDRVEVRSAESSVTLLKGESGWTVAEKAGYQANIQNLRKQLIAIAGAKIIEVKTANPDNYSRIGVGDVASGSDNVSIKLGGLAAAVELLVGKQNYQGQASTYVRRAGEAQSYLVSGSLKMDSEPSAWLMKDIFNVGSPRIRRVLLQHADGSTLEIVKSQESDPNFAVLSIPEGRELSSPGAGNSIAGGLGSLRLNDVEAAADVEVDDSLAIKGIFETFDGLRITTVAWKIEDKHYLTLAVAYDPSLVPESADSDEEETTAEEAAVEEVTTGETSAEETSAEETSAEETSAEETSAEEAAAEEAAAEEASAREAIAAEATEMQATVAGWVYVIPSYKYSNLTKTVYDLLKSLPVEEPDSDE